MSRRELSLFAVLGFGVWVSGAVMFRLGGRLLFESGTFALALSGVAIAVTVCLLLNGVMGWRKAPASQALVVAVVMALPGLFGDVAYVLVFSIVTGLPAAAAGPYAAIVIFGNAALLAFALYRAWPSLTAAPS